jgi:hypothetical protein
MRRTGILIVLVEVMLAAAVGGAVLWTQNDTPDARVVAAATPSQPKAQVAIPPPPAEPFRPGLGPPLIDADNDPARLYGEWTGYMPLAGYVNAQGETTAYVLQAQMRDPNHTGLLDVVTIKGTKVGKFGGGIGDVPLTRPDPDEVNRVAAEEASR